MKSSLFAREWIVIFFLLSLIGAMALVASVKRGHYTKKIASYQKCL